MYKPADRELTAEQDYSLDPNRDELLRNDSKKVNPAAGPAHSRSHPLVPQPGDDRVADYGSQLTNPLPNIKG